MTAARGRPGADAQVQVTEMTIYSAAILLFFVLDPVGNVALFVPALARVDPRRRIRVLVRELLIALAALLLFLALGGVTLRPCPQPACLSISAEWCSS